MSVAGTPVSAREGRRFTTLLVLVGFLLAAGIALSAFRSVGIGWFRNFFLIFSAIVVEAFPFVLVGALVASAIEIFVPTKLIGRVTKLPKPLQLPAAGLAGVAFPVCECGSVPVARRLAKKGLPPAAAITFMLAAPILNPIVVISTFVAYRGRSILWVMVFGRFALGLIVAVAVGWIMSGDSKRALLKERPGDTKPGHEHRDPEPTWKEYFSHVGNDFIFMGRFLLMGAAVAAAIQTFVPQTVITKVAGRPILDIVAMMGLAFVLSLCSESDAFIAASFVQFGAAAQLAFLVFGPMMDLKLAALYIGTFDRAFFWKALLAVGAVTLVGTLWIQAIAG
jgi:uncharacterized membrane protein YraQ (UPF0718 family)